MCQEKQKVVQVSLNEFRTVFGEKSYETAMQMAVIMKNYLEKGDRFTGKIVFTVDCNNGGIGNVSAFVQKRL